MVKLVWIFVLASALQVMAGNTKSYSQDTKLDLSLKNASLESIIWTMKKQSEFSFFYNSDDVKGVEGIDADFKNSTAEEILNTILEGTGLTFDIVHKTVIIRKDYRIKPRLVEKLDLQQPQQKEISGKVTDSSGLPLPGVSVIVKGTTLGTVSNSDGEFLLYIPIDAKVLQFSFVGMQTQEVAIGGRNSFSIVMDEETFGVEEVVVTALGIEKNKRILTYATQQVGMDAVTTVKDISLGNALAGKLAGVYVSTGSGAAGVGAGSRIIIRGERSISGGNTPLIIMDGVPSNFGIDNINPDDVESINVLKGPSASALYGSSANNGVIIVTTKKGKAGETKVEVNSLTSFDIPYLYPEFQNVYGQGTEGIFNPYEQISSWGPNMEGQTVTDFLDQEISLNPRANNVKDFFRTGHNLTNSISYSTGNEKSAAYFSYTNITAGGVIPVNNMQRHNFNVRMNTELLKNLKLDFVMTWLKGQSENAPVTGDDLFSPMWQLLKMPRSMRTEDIRAGSYYDEELFTTKQITWAPGSTAVINPYWSIYGREAYNDNSNLNTVLALKYDFTPWLYLQLRGRMAKNYRDYEEKLYWDTQYVNSGKGKYTREYYKTQYLNGDVLLGFNKNITDDFNLSANLGAEIRDNKSANLKSNTGKLIIENKFFLKNGETVETSDDESHTQNQAVYGTVQFGFRDYLFLDVTARNDWNSTLPAPHNYFYPSVGLSGVLSDMFVMPEFISFLKVRGSYAEVGAGAGFAQIFQTFARGSDGEMGMVYPSSRRVPTELIPERTKSWEVGAELRFFDDKLGFDVTGYKSNTYNQLVHVTSAPSSGYSNAGINCGNIQNKGIELMVSTVPLQTRDMKWNLNLNFSRNMNEVIELTETLDRYEIATPQHSIGDSWIIVGKPYGEILSRGFMRNEEGQIIVDEAGLPRITPESELYLGNFNYDWRGGLTSNFRYKNWNLYFLIDLNYGGVRQSASEAQMALSGTSKATLNGRDGFVFDGVKEIDNGDETFSYVPNDIEITAELYGKHIGGRATNGAGEVFNHEATNSRLRELSLGYTLPVRNTVIKSITISAVGRNLFYLYNGCGWFDPDVTYDVGKNGQGSESA
ncbi:MAG: SusC/RagA family TonB-linked outer membrane protein, partial [Mariniphaga sp.]|nr:SusC/RagA family TonB-linked outer membrane protein [Mariniphaga sp.]